MPTIEEATDFLRGIKPGQRVSLFDPRAVNHPGKWCARYVLEGEQPNLPYNPICRNRNHFRIYMQVWEHTGFVDNLCACELANGRKRLTVWEMPEDAKHSMSATGFDNGKHYEERRTWQSTRCGVLLETTGDAKLWEQGHRSYISPANFHLINCPGCLMKEGKPPAEIEGVTVFGVAA
ncbi:hypothetical protein ABZ379_06215 [Streptomyces canus]|uniref:hypothetical protein n=1 Tax=Streptomyces canus TaxID=58343 RepID=UPI0033F1B83C